MSNEIQFLVTEQQAAIIEMQPPTVVLQMGAQGPAGPSAHGELSGLALDQHLQYHNDSRGDARYTPLAHASDTANPHEVTAAQAGADATGTAAAAVSAHAGGTDVHAIASVTGLQSSLDAKSSTAHDHAATYAPIAKGVTNGDAHNHDGGDGGTITYSSLSGTPTLGNAAALNVGTTAGTVAAGDDLRIVAATPAETTTTIGALIAGATAKSTPVDADSFGLSDSEAAGITKKFTWASFKAAFNGIFSPASKGVTNGDSHDHSGGDGAQIAYSGLSGLPTLGSAAATSTTAYEPTGVVSAHAALTTTHGISSFGATLVDDTSASAARTTLGLGSAAVLSVGTTTGTVAAGDDSRLTTGLTGLTSGGVLFANSSTTAGQDSTKLFWNATTKRLGIGTASPRTALEIYADSQGNVGSFLFDQPTSPTGTTNLGPHFFMKSGGNNRGWIGFFDSAVHGQGTKLNIKSAADVGFRGGNIALADQVTLIGTTGNLGIGTLTPSERLDVAGNISSFDGDFILKRTTSTTDNIPAASIISAWTVNTHASRQGEVSIGASDYNGRKEAIKVGANGAAATFSAFGVPLTTRPAALTTQLTTISYVEPGTPDYALQGVISGGYGFATADEGLTLLKVIANLQVRLGQAENALKSLGWLS